MSRASRIFLAGMLAVGVSPSLVAVKKITLFAQVNHPATAENRKTIHLLLAQAANYLCSRYGAFVKATAAEADGAGRFDLGEAVTAVFSEVPSQNVATFLITHTSDGSQIESGALVTPI